MMVKRRLLRWAVPAALLLLPLSYFLLDRPIARVAEQLPVRLNPLLHRISDLSGVLTITVAVTVMVAVFFIRAYGKGHPRRPMLPLLYIATSALTASLVTETLKKTFARYRPAVLIDFGRYGFEFWKDGFYYNSFPSGHAAVAFAFFGALALCRRRWRVWGFVIAGLVAVSRVLLNLHFLSDIIAGALLGTGLALLYRRLFNRFGLQTDSKEVTNND